MRTKIMIRKYMLLLLSVFLFVSAGEINEVAIRKIIVYKYNIDDQIAKPMWRTTQKCFEKAKRLGADIILIQMNTYGGLVDIADSIRTKILNSPIPVYVFIDDNAASAGALIYLGKKLLTTPVFLNISLRETQQKEDGFTSADPAQHEMIGLEGTAYTVLRPSGKVEVKGDIYDAKSEFGFIEKGTKVKIVRYETGQLYVERTNIL